MSSICPSKSLLPSPYTPAQESFLWPLASVGLAIGICSRRWEGVKEGVRSGYFLPWLLPFKMSSGQMCSSGRSHWTSWWPTPHSCFQFPLPSPSACFFGPRGDGICWWWLWVTALCHSSHRLLAGTLIGWAGDYSSLFGLWVWSSCRSQSIAFLQLLPFLRLHFLHWLVAAWLQGAGAVLRTSLHHSCVASPVPWILHLPLLVYSSIVPEAYHFF